MDDLCACPLHSFQAVYLLKRVTHFPYLASLVPYIHHADIIKSAIKFKKHFVSTSYVSPAMIALDEAYVACNRCWILYRILILIKRRF